MITEWVSVCSSLIFMALACSPAGAVKIEPPWEKSPANGVNFTVPGIDNVPDLHGDIVNPDLVIFFGGNEFMVVPDLLSAFKKKYPQYKRIFAETLPPGILPRQVEQGALIIGNLRLEIAPDVWTSGKDRIEELQKSKNLFDDTVTYTKNQLAIMVYRGNPKKISSLVDLGKSDIKVSMPDPDLEDIGKKIIKAYQKVGGQELAEQIMTKKTGWLNIPDQDSSPPDSHPHHAAGIRCRTGVVYRGKFSGNDRQSYRYC